MKKKTCKHKWVFDKEVTFPKEYWHNETHRMVYHCEKCMHQNIQTIYR